MKPHPLPPTAQRRALRSIAAFELFKGVVALAAGLGLLSLLHRDLPHIAATLIGHIGLDPGAHYPAMFLREVDVLHDTSRRTLLLAIVGYVTVRLFEGWGLWHGRRWGEWLGALSGLVYVPFELRHLLHRPDLTGLLVVLFNLAIVAFLGWQLWSERERSRA
ncbi:MAG: DUF2127 domain-containing protein [Burkholderiales bacterium]|nr:DUF2127 domain-containing protein [Burkholderiales bacterium]MDE2456520.1 DUF2127 domain-containing protein [Burkholderiales bacterium]